MQEQIGNVAKEIVRSPELLKQAVVLVSGVVFFVFLQANTGFDPLNKFQQFEIGSIERSFIFLAVSYIGARLLILLAGALNGLLGILDELFRLIFDPRPFSTRWSMFVGKLGNPEARNKIILSFLTGREHLDPKSPADQKNQITIIDYARIIQKYPSIDNRAETSLTSLEFTRILLGASLIFTYILSLNYLFLILLLLWLQEKLQRSLQNTNYGLYLAAVKYLDRPTSDI